MNHLESKIQCALVEWARWQQTKHPELELLHAVPNGGRRGIVEAVRLKREGVLAGIPDLFLPCARRGYHGLYLETKAPKERISPAQKKIAALLGWQNYFVTSYRSLDEGIQLLEWWLE